MKCLLEAGVITPTEVIAWADETLMATEGYNDALAEVSMGSKESPGELAGRLRILTGEVDPFEVMPRVFAAMHDAVMKGSSRLDDLLGFLGSFCSQYHYEVPEYLVESISYGEDLYCAREGIYGSVGEATASSTEYLARHAG